MSFERFTMQRFVSIFRCEAEYEVDGNVVYLWEPLYPSHPLGPKDRPHWQDSHITFHREQEKDWIQVNRHLMFSVGAGPDVLVLKNGLCVEVTHAQVVWRPEHERWFIRWNGYTHTRLAKLARAGLDAWKDAD